MSALGWRGIVRRSGGKLSTWVDPEGGGGLRGTQELRIMNSELRKKTAQRGETCSAKRTQNWRKGKAGNDKSGKVETSKRPRSRSGRIAEWVPPRADLRCASRFRTSSPSLKIRQTRPPKPRRRRMEAAGIEPASRDMSGRVSTCVVRCLISKPQAPTNRLRRSPAQLTPRNVPPSNARCQPAECRPGPDSRRLRSDGLPYLGSHSQWVIGI